MAQFFPLAPKDNSYIDRMFCYYCKKCKKCLDDKGLCRYCGKIMMSDKDINVYTPMIPVRYGYSYNHFPSYYQNGMINY